MLQAILVAALLLLSSLENKTFASDYSDTITDTSQLNGSSVSNVGISPRPRDFGCPAQGCPPPGTGKFGCPTQGCQPPGTGKFGCPAQGCTPPGTGKFGCPAQGCRVDNVPLQPNQLVRSADGTNYQFQYSGFLIDMRTGAQVRVLSNVNGVLYLSNGKHIFVSTSQGAQPTTSTTLPRNSTEIVVGSFVKAVRNTDIFVGTTIVGQVYPDERYQVYKIQAPWIALKASDESILSGWILISELVVADGP